MGNIIQHLRGSVVDHSTYTGKKGEISLVTDASEARIPTGEIRIHDDSTPGGLPLVLGTTTNPLTSNIVLGSGVGINFHNYGSEDSNSATIVGNNLLDDYETGTFSFSVRGTAGTGYYTKIGQICHINMAFDSTAGTVTENRMFLPFIHTGGDITVGDSSFPLVNGNVAYAKIASPYNDAVYLYDPTVANNNSVKFSLSFIIRVV